MNNVKVHPSDDGDADDLRNDELLEEEIDVFHEEEEKVYFPLLDSVISSVPWMILINLLTVYSLFAVDVKTISTDVSSDPAFDAMTLVSMSFFFVEIVIASVCKQGYFMSFFFYLDCISTLSQLLDLTIFNIAVGLQGSSSAKSQSQLKSASNASRTGARAARVVRLVRLIRIVKLYKAAQMHQERQLELQKRKNPLDQQKSISHRAVKESRVSKRLSDSTTKKVIILVILLLLIMPLFTTDYYFTGSSSLAYSAAYLKAVAELDGTGISEVQTAQDYVVSLNRNYDTPVGYIHTCFVLVQDFTESGYSNLRETDKDYNYQIYVEGNPIMLVVGDISSVNQTSSIINIVNTIFVCCVLMFGALTFASDANLLALAPIERMIIKVNQIAQNPLIAKEMILEKADKFNETTQIENAIIKIGALLALGFGDAGCEIITMNMAKSGDIDPMLPGKRKQAIYGFCDIRNFTDATEVLQKDVMLFVNNIADIVHSMVDRYGGSANKNIGDAFLLVWKISDNEYVDQNGVVKWNNKSYIEQLADCSVIAFMKIFAKINREPIILDYRNDVRLSSRLPGYKVKMGFGLHIGWGIEGAIGSEYKIDASYLSPNVNMASRLEAATKQYGVALLISSDLQCLFSPSIKKLTRQIDHVTVKGSIRPVGFYTIEMDADELPPSKPDYAKSEKAAIMHEKKLYFHGILESDFKPENYFTSNKDLRLITRNFHQEFYHLFEQGFQGYLLGNWKEANLYFEKAKLIRPHDGPISTLQAVIAEHNGKSPTDWKGYRELTEK